MIESPNPDEGLVPPTPPPTGIPPAPSPRGPQTMVAAHLRRLTNFEYDNSVKDLLDLDARAAADFVVDSRSVYFTRNNAQRVDEARGDQLQEKAGALAGLAVQQKLARILPCAAATGAPCARQFIENFATRAFRRPATLEERDGLYVVFVAAQSRGTFNDGIDAVIQAVLQSSTFLYLSELGTGDGPTRTLNAYETASKLSFLVWGAPPDQLLLDAALSDLLKTGEARAAQVRRLLASDRAKPQLRKLVREWLGTDELQRISPEATGVNFAAMRPQFDKEADAFIDEVLFKEDGRLSTLLGADFTFANASLANHYSLPPLSGTALNRVALSSTLRRGAMTQGAFLAAHASKDNSSPVKRGVTVLRRLLCKNLSFPVGELAKQAMMVPEASTAQTTRERFASHSKSAVCASCHKVLDPLGFGFENFDQTGQFRTTENNRPIDASGTLSGTDVDGAFANSTELIGRLKESAMVTDCFARNVFRFASGSASPTDEESFMALSSGLAMEPRSKLTELLAAYAASPLFVTRSFEP